MKTIGGGGSGQPGGSVAGFDLSDVQDATIFSL